MNEDTMQACLEAGELPGTPSEVRAIEAAYEAGRVAARAECARLILETPMRPGFVLDLCREWLPDPPESA
jgi:hypothetical protein